MIEYGDEYSLAGEGIFRTVVDRSSGGGLWIEKFINNRWIELDYNETIRISDLHSDQLVLKYTVYK